MQNRPKILPSSLRENKRYIVGKIISDDKITYEQFSTEVKRIFIEVLGEYDYSMARVWIIKNLYDYENRRFIIQCNHKYTEKIRFSLALIKMIEESNVIISVLGVTGTIKSAKLKFGGRTNELQRDA